MNSFISRGEFQPFIYMGDLMGHNGAWGDHIRGGKSSKCLAHSVSESCFRNPRRSRRHWNIVIQS